MPLQGAFTNPQENLAFTNPQRKKTFTNLLIWCVQQSYYFESSYLTCSKNTTNLYSPAGTNTANDIAICFLLHRMFLLCMPT